MTGHVMGWGFAHDQDHEHEFSVKQHDYYWPDCGRAEAHDHVNHWHCGTHRHHCPTRDDSAQEWNQP